MQACLSPLVLKNRFGCLKRSSKFLSVLENVLEELEVQSIELAEEIKTMNPEILEKSNYCYQIHRLALSHMKK